ncbi:hypothetical protein K493DRAFT_407457 [Basidiobolus meristosporus CBS 931.73]|uniref:Protein YOP1 n=1 Tax=Basidiobolus meristosporus CBS 931.73 TaxID=1314790 RepID=A0A1Y1YD56_9FUNG|nr:hypothetical protein K493DRAFT_407457 [Basidiobolus meristosporus CBS 931.73]|eukprot:ORX95863.1 hypothetical protein K493DRAFT_407457 [Basidiobolus meristosporus CBS 931.73]
MGLFYLLTKGACTVSGLLYPAYASYRALDERRSDELLTWLMFWIVMGLFTAVEFVADIIIFWVPFYYQLKLAFILWLILPQTQGSTYLYKTFIHPTLIRHESEIDSMLEKVQTEIKTTGVRMGKQSVEALQKAAVESLTKGQLLIMEHLTQQTQPGSSTNPVDIQEITNDPPEELEKRQKTKTRPPGNVNLRQRTKKNDIVVVDSNLSYSDRDMDDLIGFDTDSDSSPTAHPGIP